MKRMILTYILAGLLFPVSAQLTLPVKQGTNAMTFNQIDATLIQQDFQKSVRANVHPRLFYSASTLDNIKKLIADKDPFARMYLNIARENADAALNSPLLEYKLDAAGLRVSNIHQFATQVPYLVFMYQLTGESKYANRCYEQMALLCEYPDWGADRHFLDTGIGAFCFAFVYDGLYNYLKVDQRKLLETGVRKHALSTGFYQIAQGKGVWKWYLANNNWNGICNSGLIAAALAMYETDPEFMSQVVAASVNCLPHYLVEFEPDGQSEEGLMYWSYGLMYTILGFEAMNNVLGTTYGMAETPGLLKAGWFPFLMSGPVASINIGDDPLRNSRDASFFWFAHYHNIPALAQQHYKLCLENQRCQWQDIYFYNPVLLKQTENLEIPLDNSIKGIELYSIRENWNSPDALYIAIHGGANNANHGHLDAGSFYIQAMGEVFAYGNLGRDDYTLPGYFSKKTSPDYFDSIAEQETPGRWHFYRLRTEGKNCVIVNPTIRPEQKESGVAVLKKAFSSDKNSSYTLDLSDCYERDVKYYERTIGIDRRKRELFVGDSLQCRNATSDVWWFMHTRAQIDIQEGGRTAILTMNGKRLKAEIHSTDAAAFEVLPATYLLKDIFPSTVNTANEGFCKLAIKRTGCKMVNLKVYFSPLD